MKGIEREVFQISEVLILTDHTHLPLFLWSQRPKEAFGLWDSTKVLSGGPMSLLGFLIEQRREVTYRGRYSSPSTGCPWKAFTQHR